MKYIYQRNKGSGSARNNGICHVKGKYVAFLDSDDIWLPNKLEVQINYMEENSDIVWSHSLYETFGYGNNMRVDTSDYKGFIFPDCMSSCKIATPCVVIRSDILKQNTALRFNEKMRYGQDFYLWVLMSVDYKLGHVDEILSKVRMRGGNAAKRAYVMLKAKSELWNNLSFIKEFPIDHISKSVNLAYFFCN